MEEQSQSRYTDASEEELLRATKKMFRTTGKVKMTYSSNTG